MPNGSAPLLICYLSYIILNPLQPVSQDIFFQHIWSYTFPLQNQTRISLDNMDILWGAAWSWKQRTEHNHPRQENKALSTLKMAGKTVSPSFLRSAGRETVSGENNFCKPPALRLLQVEKIRLVSISCFLLRPQESQRVNRTYAQHTEAPWLDQLVYRASLLSTTFDGILLFYIRC